jgi:hypothetical protein
MKKKKVTEKENEWKGVLQAEIANVKKLNSTKITLDADKKELVITDIENPEFKQVMDMSMLYNSSNYFQESKPIVTPCSDNPTTTKGSDFDIDKDYCNVGVNKDWGVTKEELSKFYHDNWIKGNINYKQKRIDFEFTPLTFWQLTPSIAVNLSMKEVEFVWLCFGMYINFKRNEEIPYSL